MYHTHLFLILHFLYLCQGSYSHQICLLLPMPGSSKKLRDVFCLHIWPWRRSVSVCLLLSIFIHKASELPGQPRKKELWLLQQRTIVSHSGQYFCSICLQNSQDKPSIFEHFGTSLAFFTTLFFSRTTKKLHSCKTSLFNSSKMRGSGSRWNAETHVFYLFSSRRNFLIIDGKEMFLLLL